MGEKLMTMHPYLFCETCGKLAPVELFDHIPIGSCLVCGQLIYFSSTNNGPRPVWFDKEEARLRGLQVYLTEDTQ